MSHLGQGQVSHPNVFEDDTATHVVSAMLYGAAAYFVFDRESSLEDDKKQVEGDANITLNKLKNLKIDVGAEASFNMDDREKAAVEKLSCTFHGDFKLPTNPASFDDAVKVYRELPKLLGENGEHAVPLRVWLYPLCKLDSRAARLQRNISNHLIKYSSDIIESLTKTEMRCNDLLKDRAAVTFPAMKEKIQDLMHNCHHYKLDFMQRLGSVLPSIRGGVKDDGALEDILKVHEKSPFNNKDLNRWLTNKEKESETLKSFLKHLEKLGATMDDNLDDLLSDLDVKNIVSFSFTSVDQPDSYLMKLSSSLKPSGMVDSPAESSYLQVSNTGWFSGETRQIMRTQLELFRELKKICSSDDTKFIVSSKYDEHYPGACILIYENGHDAICFVPPSIPATPTTADVTHNSITVQVSDPDSATLEYRVEYREKKNQETEWKSHPAQKVNEAVTLSGLKPQTRYEIRATAVGKLNYAVSSAATVIAVSPPTQGPGYTETTENAMDLSSKFQTSTMTSGISSIYKNIISKSVEIHSGLPTIYQLQPKKEEIETLTRVTLGEKKENSHNKTILLVGETGSGKSTLINSIVNYAMGVTWKDNVWFQIVEEERRNQSESQTVDVIVYEIFGFEGKTLPYSLTLIDTPGYGDTSGAGHDVIVSQRLFDLFRSDDGVKELNAVGLVLKASDNRVTERLMYVHQSLMSLFGKDMEENIVALITHSNGRTPKDALQALETADIKCAKNEKSQPCHFLFDNFQHEDRTEGPDTLQDNISVKGIQEFTAFLEKIKPQKLCETVEVLNGRIRLTDCIQNLQERIKLIDLKQNETKQTQEALKKYELEMEKNEKFTVEVDEPYKDKKYLKDMPFFLRLLLRPRVCTVCERNCSGLLFFSYLLNMNCSKCTKQCPASDHMDTDWLYVVKTRRVQRTEIEIQKKYEDNKAEAMNQLSLLENLEKQMDDLATEMSELLEEAYQHVVKLDQIALNVNAISTHVHLDYLIEKMKEKGETAKVNRLKDMRRRQNKKIQQALKYLFAQIYETP